MFNRKHNKFIALFLLLSFSAGCSTSPDRISASYVSPYQYQNYSCDQVSEELLRVNQKVMEITGKQRGEATKDALAMTVGLVIFWPALFFLIGEDKKEELSNLKGEYEALQRIAISKRCNTLIVDQKKEGTQPLLRAPSIL